MTTADLIIAGRRVVTDTGVGPAVITVSNGTIANVALGAHAPAGALDVGDFVLMPGLVDSHVHVNEPGRTEWEGFKTAGRAAAAGGVTTIVVMPLNCSPVATTAAALQAETHAAAASCIVDFAFWGGVVPGNLADLRPLWDAGVLGFKCFLVHSGIDDFPNVTAADLGPAMQLLATLDRPRGTGATLLVHAEDPGVIDAARAPSGLDRSPRSYAAYRASRPPEAEARAVAMMIELCRAHRTPVHIVHVAAASALPLLAAARREELPITAETCPHYLALAAEEIAEGKTVFKCAPPIRERANQDALWTGLRDGVLDLVASDHSPCPPDLKRADSGDFAAAWGGISSLQLGLHIMLEHALRRGFTVEHIARWMCENPARLAGIDAFKGRIAPGCDADLVVLDPEARWTVRGATLQHRHKLTPYDGASVRGVVHATFVRGRPVYATPAFAAKLGVPRPGDGFSGEACGRWVKRSKA